MSSYVTSHTYGYSIHGNSQIYFETKFSASYRLYDVRRGKETHGINRSDKITKMKTEHLDEAEASGDTNYAEFRRVMRRIGGISNYFITLSELALN